MNTAPYPDYPKNHEQEIAKLKARVAFLEMAWTAERVEKLLAILAGALPPEPPILRPGATIRAKQDTKSINGLNIPKGQLLRVTAHSEALVTARIGEHGEGLVATVQPSYFEVIG